jgi:hypothetical protein
MICSDCGKHFGIGDWPFACAGLGHAPGSFWVGDAGIHTSQKVVVLENKYNGDVKIPGRGDRAVHPKLVAEGYVRKELDTMADIRRVERKTGTVHEAGSYGNNDV